MKKYFIIILLLGIVFKGYTQELKWIKSEGLTTQSVRFYQYIGIVNKDKGTSIVTDNNNNTYLTGYYYNAVDEQSGVFLVKYNSLGVKTWYKKITSQFYGMNSMLVGNRYYYSPTVEYPDFQIVAINNAGQIVVSAKNKLFKLDTSGNIIWQKNVVDTIKSISFDASDNIYLTGQFSGTIDFNPSLTDTFNLTSTGGSDAYILKTNTNGDFLWAKNIGGIANDEANCIKVDIYGNVFFTGSFQSSCDFNPNSGIYNIISNGLSDAFVCCLNTSGNFIWAKKMGGISNDKATFLNIDFAGNVYLTGTFTNTFKYDTLNSSSMFGLGAIDVFVCKISATGAFIWGKNFGSTENINATCLAKDEKSNIYLAGSFKGQIVLPNNITNDFLSSSENAFLTKFDSTGVLIGIRKIGGISAKSISVNIEDHIFIHAGTNSNSNFDISGNEFLLDNKVITYKLEIKSWKPKSFLNIKWGLNYLKGSVDVSSTDIDENENWYTCSNFTGLVNISTNQNNSQNIISKGSYDILIMKYDSNRNLIWSKTIGGIKSERCQKIILDDSNNIYLVGKFSGTLDFDPGDNVFNLTSFSSANDDIFILKLNNNGNFIWAKSFSGSNAKFVSDIKIDKSGDLICIGNYIGTIDFDPGINSFNLSNSGSNYGVFICKLNSNGLFNWAKSINSVGDWNSFKIITTDQSDNIIVLGVFKNLVDFDPDSGIFNLTSNTSSHFILKLNTLGQFIWANKLETNSTINEGDIEIDSKNNIVAFGSFNNTFRYDNVSDSMISNGLADLFLLKLDSNGTHIWQKNLGGIGNDYSTFISLDFKDNIFLTGSFYSEADFDPSNNEFILKANDGSNNFTNIFILKLNSNANFLWAQKIGSSGAGANVSSNSIYFSPRANIYVTGGYNNSGSKILPFMLSSSPGGFYLDNELNNGYLFAAKYKDSDLDIITQPTDRFANIGSNTSFTVSANKSNLTYQWQQKINNTFVNLTNSAKVNGVNSVTLSLIGVDYKNNNNNTFRCIIFDDTNSIASNSAQLFINCNFSIVKNPSVQNIGIGNEAKYTIVCSSSNLTYQWQEKTSSNNFINITDTNQFIGITNDTLIIKEVQTSQNLNRYRCVVSDSVCSATSIDVRLSVLCNLNFSVQPKNQSTINDSIAVFKVKVWNKNASYQWQQKIGNGSFTNLKDSLNFSGTSSDSLVINSAKLSQNKSVFQCIVTDNYCNIISDTAVLSVNCATEIISQPTNSNTKLDSNATFTVFASGGSNIYQWQINKGNGFENIADSARFNGIKTPNLIVNNVDFSFNNSSFRCLITNGSCLQTTASVTLSVICNFNIISQPDSQNVKSGSPAYFKIKTNADSLTYQWQTKLGGNFYNISNNTVFSGADTDSLIIFNCNLAQDGSLFKCIISSKNCSVISNLFKLNVNCSNIIVNQPKNRIVPSKSSTFFHIATANTNSVNYQWQIKQIGGGFINLNNSNFYNGVNTDTLKLENVNLSLNNQTYRCLVNYFECSNISDEVNLSVYCPKDSNLTNPINLNASKGADAIFTTKINIPFVSYQWQKNKVNLTDTNKFKGINTDTLVIKKISLNDEGNYRCLFSYGECIDLSQEAKLSVSNVGYNIISSQLLNIYPNPNNGEFTLTFNQNNEPKTIEILDALGKLQATFITNNQTYQAQLNHLAKGIYFVKINTPNAQQIVKLLIE